MDKGEVEGEDIPIPPYVCCVLTEGIWTIFLAALLIIVLFTVATLKYFKKYLAHSKFTRRNLKLMSRFANEDGKNAAALIRYDAIPVPQFQNYCSLRRKKQGVNELEFVRAVQNVKSGKIVSLGTSGGEGPPSSRSAAVDLQATPSLADGIGATRFVDDDGRLGRPWIVTRGPSQSTLTEFWSLVWQENTRVVVMLTRTFECIKVMCFQYWPNTIGVTEVHGDVSVTLLREEIYAHYKISILKLAKGKEERTLSHFHYLEWPVYQIADSSSFLLFLNHLQEELDNLSGMGLTRLAPSLVHCHDGSGRSGAFLAIQANLVTIAKSDEVNVFETVRWLRNKRRGLVADPEQYRFIYNVLEDYVVSGETQIEADRLRLQMAKLATAASPSPRSGSPSESPEPALNATTTNGRRRSGVDGFEAEFRQLSALRPHFTIGDCAAGHRTENRTKNRSPSIVPPDEKRPYLTSFQNTCEGDYINAVMVDSYTSVGSMVCTEWPMRSTQANFWSMVYDHDVRVVVVMDPVKHDLGTSNRKNETKTFERFWPTSSYPTAPNGGINGGGKNAKLVDEVATTSNNLEKDFSHGQNNFGGGVFSVEMVGHSKFSESIDCWNLKVKKLSLLNLSHPDLYSCLDVKKAGSSEVSLYHISNSSVVNSQNSRGSSAINGGSRRVVPAPSTGVAAGRTEMLNLLLHLSEWRNNNGKDGRVAVVSHDGVSKIGVFCTASYCYEQIGARGLVDVFQAARNAKKFRPQLVTNVTEYKMCYDLVLEYVIRKIRRDPS